MLPISLELDAVFVGTGVVGAGVAGVGVGVGV